METDFAERRRHIRVYFDSLEETNCRFAAEEQEAEIFTASVLDLSLGGMHLTVMGNNHFTVADRLIMNIMTHRTGRVCDEQIIMEIRWVFSREEFSRLYMGCQFLYLPEKSRGHIANLISAKLLETSTARIGMFTT